MTTTTGDEDDNDDDDGDDEGDEDEGDDDEGDDDDGDDKKDEEWRLRKNGGNNGERKKWAKKNKKCRIIVFSLFCSTLFPLLFRFFLFLSSFHSPSLRLSVSPVLILFPSPSL